MKLLDYGIRFIFTEDYETKHRYYKKGTKRNILNGVVVLGELGEFLFDVDSNLAKKFGEIIN